MASTKTYLLVSGGAVAVGVGAAIVWRLRERRKLAQLLSGSTMVAEARDLALIDWTPEEKAAEMLPLFSSASADHGYAEVLAEVHELIPEKAADLLSLTDDAKRVFEEKTGVNVDSTVAAAKVTATTAAVGGRAAAAGVYSQLPDLPLVDVVNWLPSSWRS